MTGLGLGLGDFSIIVLNETVQLDGKISVIKLPTENVSCPEGKNMIASGWGNTWLYKYIPNLPLHYILPRFLMATKQNCLDVETHCNGVLHTLSQELFENANICAGDLKSTKNGVCFGDSGGNHLNELNLNAC